MGYREKWFQNNKPVMGRYYCVECNHWFAKSEVDIDHIIPQSKGGTDDLWNLQCMCKHCNRSKQDKLNGVPSDLAINIGKNIIKKLLK